MRFWRLYSNRKDEKQDDSLSEETKNREESEEEFQSDCKDNDSSESSSVEKQQSNEQNQTDVFQDELSDDEVQHERKDQLQVSDELQEEPAPQNGSSQDTDELEETKDSDDSNDQTNSEIENPQNDKSNDDSKQEQSQETPSISDKKKESQSQEEENLINNQNVSVNDENNDDSDAQSFDQTNPQSLPKAQTEKLSSSGLNDKDGMSSQDNSDLQSTEQTSGEVSQSDVKSNPHSINMDQQLNEMHISEADVMDTLNKLQSQESSIPTSSEFNDSYQGEEPDENEVLDESLDSKDPDDTSKDLENKNEQSKDNDAETEQQTDNIENIDDRKEKLQSIREQLKQLLSQVNQQEENQEKTVSEVKKELEKRHLTGEKEQPIESFEEDYDMSNANQELLDRLNELMPFESRDRGPGYAIDTNGHTDVPDSVIRTLITRFLNQRFIKRDTDLNIRSNSLEKTSGFYKWDTKAVVTHLQTHQITKVLTDKYGYKYDDGKNENVPLSFYFDLSGSMAGYTNLLSTIAIELLKKDVKVLVGFNERVNYQIDSIRKIITVKELADLLTKVGDYNVGELQSQNANMKKINRNIDNYLISSKAEKCVIFSDFDALSEIMNLSQKCNIYWFCFESEFKIANLKNYQGFIYPVQNIQDIALGLLKVSDYRFETLCYLEKENGRGKVLKL